MASPKPPSRLFSRLSLQRLGLLSVLVAAFGIIIAYDLHTYLSYQTLADNLRHLRAFVADTPLLAMAAYIAVYIIVVAFSLPGATLMTLSGGLLFGILTGGLLTVFAATIGATLVFLAARYLIGDMLRARGGARLQSFEAAFRNDAISYLLVLRLLPIFPFFIVNLGTALVGAPFMAFVLTTFFGIMPGTFVFVSIGNGAAAILAAGEQPNLGVIFEPQILYPLIGLAILSLLPVLWRKFKKSA